MRQLYKVEWDRDYHTVTDHYYISTPEEVSDDWTGYNYWYHYDSSMRGGSLNAEEAREYLSGRAE